MLTPPTALLADLRGRGVRLELAPGGIRYHAPSGRLTKADRAALLTHKTAILAELRAEASRAITTTPAPAPGGAKEAKEAKKGPGAIEAQPTRPCELCVTTAWAWHADWPEPGTGRWLCATCVARPTAPTIAEVHAQLPIAERQQLRAEADNGGQLAQLVLQVVACTPDPAAWRLYSRRLDRELWLARDAEAAAALDADGARGGLPVVLADDLERLRDFDDRRLNDLLDVLIHFPGARIAELDPKAAS
jgi:hypothetical protein